MNDRNCAPASGGTLYVVATPIGNLDDLTRRAENVLRGADLVAAEDTRTAAKLLNHCGIRKPLLSLYRENTARRVPEILGHLAAAKSVVVISESGTPTLSDPGVEIVRAAHEAGHAVRAVPGPSAVAAALSISGIAADHFIFAGFLPRREGKRLRLLERLAAMESPIVLYESPYRVVKTLEDIRKVFGDVLVAVAREMTKVHEELRRAPCGEHLAHFTKTPPRGEFTIVIDGRNAKNLPLPEER